MALHFALKVNGNTIGYFEARRREDAVPANRICVYDVQVVQNQITVSAVVEHNYDDGPFSLVAKALKATNSEFTQAHLNDDPPFIEWDERRNQNAGVC